MKSNSRGTALRGNERLMGHSHGKNMFKTLKRTKKQPFLGSPELMTLVFTMELLYSTWRQHICKSIKSTSFGCFCTPTQIITIILLKCAFFCFLYNYRVSSWTNCGDIFSERTQTSALWRSHGCFGLYEVARWHIKSGMYREGHVLAMRRRGGAAGTQTFEKTTGKNQPWMFSTTGLRCLVISAACTQRKSTGTE